jgi:hypothetical protein
MAYPKTTDAALQAAVDAVALRRRSGARGFLKLAAGDLALPLNTLRSRLAIAAERGIGPSEKPRVRVKAGSTPDPVQPTAHTLEELGAQLSQLRAALRDARAEAIDARFVRRTILRLAETTPIAPSWTVEESSGGSAPGTPITVWSDWHWGEVVRAQEVSGVNAFDIEVARARVRRLVERTIDLCFRHMVNPVYPGIVIALGGDMVTGEIHQELAETNDQTIVQAVFNLQDVLAWAIGEMADRFGRVFLPCVVGNHGRTTLKPRAKGRVHTSYEWLLYCQLERHFAGDGRIRFHIPGEADAHFRVNGHRYCLTHGDSLGVKGGDGIIGALGPIARGTVKLRNSEAQIGREFDTLILGHWHQYLPMPGCVVNGTLKGYDEYARLYLRARYQRPIQALWFDHPRHGPTYQVPVYCDETAPTAQPRSWLEWAA